MSEPLPVILRHLTRLVAADTQNPPRALSAGAPPFAALLCDLVAAGFSCQLKDLGKGLVWLLATRGRPTVLFNVHLDTVPAAATWSRDPHALLVNDDRAIGLGACDIKGAAAALLGLAELTDLDLALLFTSDEELGEGVCVGDFLATAHGFTQVIVAEPTGAKAVLAHRGIVTANARFSGVAGHAAAVADLDQSAVHQLLRFGARALDLAKTLESERFEALSGVRFNLAPLSGGTKTNMVADAAEARFGLRLLPHQDPQALLARFFALAPQATFKPGFYGAPLPVALPGRDTAARLAEARAFIAGLPEGPPVDFWTEAPLFSAAGLTAVVLGPGHIQQAHAADEWVALDQLTAAFAAYERVVRGTR